MDASSGGSLHRLGEDDLWTRRTVPPLAGPAIHRADPARFARKALKAVHQARGEEAWGHTVTVLLAGCMSGADFDACLARAKALDKHYIPSRYPNGFESGAPMDFYTSEDAGKAIEDAGEIVTRCQDLLR